MARTFLEMALQITAITLFCGMVATWLAIIATLV